MNDDLEELKWLIEAYRERNVCDMDLLSIFQSILNCIENTRGSK